MNRSAIKVFGQIVDIQTAHLREVTADLSDELTRQLIHQSTNDLKYTTHELEQQRKANSEIIDSIYSFFPTGIVTQAKKDFARQDFQNMQSIKSVSDQMKFCPCLHLAT